MTSKSFYESLEELAMERGLTTESIMEKVEIAMGVACRDTEYNGAIKVEYDTEKKTVNIYDYKYVVAELTEGNRGEITIEQAKQYRAKPKVGMEIKTKVDITKFGRKVAAKFKNTLSNELKNLEREESYTYFSQMVGEIVTAKVVDSNVKFVTFSIGKNTFASMPITEGIPGETYEPGDTKVVYINKVEKTTKGPKVFICRNNREIVKKLFEREIVEVRDGTVEIMGIAREPGSRTKVGVMATKPTVDPKGACVGQGGNRIKAINEALNNEKIDIFTWREDPVALISEALLPAHSLGVVILSEKEKQALVIVSDDQFSLAIGKSGQNVRLAAYSIDWRIDIKRLSDAVDEGIKFTYNIFNH